MTKKGNGSFIYPWDLQIAQYAPSILPGQTLFLRGGTYTGDFILALNGSAEEPITVKPYNSESVIIDGSLVIRGSNVIVEGIEVMYSGWQTRTSQIASSVPADMPTGKGVSVEGSNIKLVNVVAHDLIGFGFLSASIGSELHNCLIYNIGWIGPDRGHGHSLYIQNDTGIKLIKNCIMLNSFCYGVHAYAEGGDLNNLHFEKNIVYNSGADYVQERNIHVGGYTDFTGLVLDGNMTYNGQANRIGYSSNYTADDVTLVDNYLPDGLVTSGTVNYTVNSGNVTSLPESGTKVFVCPNDYDNTTGIVAVYNWDGLDSVDVCVDAMVGLAAGDAVVFRCAEDWRSCVQSFALDETLTVSVDMRAVVHSVAEVIGHNERPPTTFPTFGCFVVNKA